MEYIKTKIMNRIELIEKINSLKMIQNAHVDDLEFPQEIQEVLDTCPIVDSECEEDEYYNKYLEEISPRTNYGEDYETNKTE